MIRAIGSDIIEINRFASWYAYPQQQLSKIFSDREISYCLSHQSLAAQRFAVRFAAKEALYKALWAAQVRTKFFLMCRHAEIITQKGIPIFKVNWQALPHDPMNVHVTLTHNKSQAFATVLLESLD